MKQVTERKASELFCPLTMGSNLGASKCLGSHCMAWVPGAQAESLPVGMSPEGEGWEKDGLPIGAGGAVTHRQNWKRLLGRCGMVSVR